MATGNPKPNYYVGTELTGTVLNGTNGIYHGGDVSPKVKILHKLLISSTGAATSPLRIYVCDYLMFYPLIDMDSTSEQTFFNPTPLPRYPTGAGVQAFLVATVPYVGNATFNIRYRNEKNEVRESVVETCNIATTISHVLNSATPGFGSGGGPFIRLASGDHGIRSVEAITNITPNGGLAALVLVKPLAFAMTNELTACTELDFLTMKSALPIIKDGAYLNLMVMPSGDIAAKGITGMITTVWN